MNLSVTGRAAALMVAAAIAGCGGGGGGGGTAPVGVPPASGGVTPTPAPTPTPTPTPTPVPTPVPPTVPASACNAPVAPALPSRLPTAAESSRFLAQSTFGPTPSEIERVSAIGYQAWIHQQVNEPASSHLAFFRSRAPAGSRDPKIRQAAWWTTALRHDDQLRQRVALALSEIFVVSEVAPGLFPKQEGLCYYYDLLVNGAFGSYRELLEQVTLSPEMGRYLSMLGNPKPDAAAGTRSDENFAREVMQLFSLGTALLDSDGTIRRDSAGKPLPTYTQDDIVNLARALTGWSWRGADNFRRGPENWTAQMTVFRAGGSGVGDFHDTGAKTLVGGVYLPPGQTAEQDMEMALDALASHPNVAPFISRLLIQRLVTSNPTRDYVRRVATRFRDSGGNLGTTVQAILLDPEARLGAEYLGDRFGKVREPLLRATQFWRAFSGRADGSTSGDDMRFDYPQFELEQSALRAPSVFNFFSPSYAAPFSARGIEADPCATVAPELQIANESSLPTVDNFLLVATQLHNGPNAPDAGAPHNVEVEYLQETALAQQATPDALLDHLDVLLTGGRMDADLRREIASYIQTLPASQPDRRAQEAIYLVISSPQNIVQR